MEFFIKQNATLPVLKMQVVKDGRAGYLELMQDLEVSTIFFTMIDVETGIPKIVSKPAYIVELVGLDENAPPEYYVYYRFTSRDTNTAGRYVGQFLVKYNQGLLGGPQGDLILPLRDALYINVEPSFISLTACC